MLNDPRGWINDMLWSWTLPSENISDWHGGLVDIVDLELFSVVVY